MLLNPYDLNLNFNIQLATRGRLDGTDGDDLQVSRRTGSLLVGNEGTDIQLGQNGRDRFNPGSGNAQIYARNSSDRIYINSTFDGDEVYIDLTDTDKARDYVFFGNDVKNNLFVGQTFVEIDGFSKEDTMVFNNLSKGDDYFFGTSTSSGDYIISASVNGELSSIVINDIDFEPRIITSYVDNVL